MTGFNRVFLIGNLTRDPDLRRTQGGQSVCNMSIAINRKTKDRDEVTYVDIVAWEQQAENCHKFLKTGAPIHVEGYLKADSWDDKDTGAKRTAMKVHATSVNFLGGGQGGNGNQNGGNQGRSNRQDDDF